MPKCVEITNVSDRRKCFYDRINELSSAMADVYKICKRGSGINVEKVKSLLDNTKDPIFSLLYTVIGLVFVPLKKIEPSENKDTSLLKKILTPGCIIKFLFLAKYRFSLISRFCCKINLFSKLLISFLLSKFILSNLLLVIVFFLTNLLSISFNLLLIYFDLLKRKLLSKI